MSEGQEAIHVDVRRDERSHGVAEGRGEGEFGPGNLAAIAVGDGAVAERVLTASIETERDAGEDVGRGRDEDEQGLEGKRLVVWAREEEVIV